MNESLLTMNNLEYSATRSEKELQGYQNLHFDHVR